MIIKFLKCDRGNVESALVLIPLLSLFLIATQINVAIHSRNMETLVAQDQASKQALSGEFGESEVFLPIYSPDPNQNLDLVMSTRTSKLATLLGEERFIEVRGIALVENQR